MALFLSCLSIHPVIASCACQPFPWLAAFTKSNDKKSSAELFLQTQGTASCSEWSFEAGMRQEWGPSNAYCLYSNTMYYKGCVCILAYSSCVCMCVCPLSFDHRVLKKQDLSGLLQSESIVDIIGTLKCKH